MSKLPQFVEKYLAKNSFGNWELEIISKKDIEHVIVIPSISEYQNLKKLLISISNDEVEYLEKTLILFVINNLESSSEEVKNDNKISLDFLRDFKAGNQSGYEGISNNLRIGIIDCATKGSELPEKDGGVGLARKIGMDLALNIFDYSINKKKILTCLDSDCIVSKNYCGNIIKNFNGENISAAVIKFKHLIPDNINEANAIICYEIFLRYYVLGLQLAESSYAFHTIGSSMTCDIGSYVKIGGMNKRKAAEDFYFLEKLSKNVPIHKIDSAIVYPSPRESWRVPFGTGQRVNRFISNSQNEYLLYNPKSFFILKSWLLIFNQPEIRSADEYLGEAKSIDNKLFQFLIDQNFHNQWTKIVKNSGSNVQINKQKKLWFDGFKTLKLIHYLRDTDYSLVNMFDALDEMLSAIGIIEIPQRENVIVPSLEVQKEYLKLLRELN